MLTEDFAKSHVKKRVKKGGSLPSVIMYTGALDDRFSNRKSCSRNFCCDKKKITNKEYTTIGSKVDSKLEIFIIRLPR